MVLQGGPCGRVDRRRTSFIKSAGFDFDQSMRSFFYAQNAHGIFIHNGLYTQWTSCKSKISSCLIEDLTMTSHQKKSSSELASHPGINAVELQGRISAPPTTKLLPSGDEVVEFRIIIDRVSRNRGSKSARGGSRREVDVLEIAAWKARERRLALSLKPGEWVHVMGSVHRRFWSTPAGLASRWQVEVDLLKRL